MKKMTSTSVTKQNYRTINNIRTFTVKMDNLPENGGEDFGATPKEHICMALGSCTTMTLKSFLKRKEWTFGEITAETSFWMEEGQSCFSVDIRIEGNFDDKQKKRLQPIAHLCPVHKMLSKGNRIVVDFEYRDLKD